jgi:DNA-binding response OmpR family regulator
MSKHIVVIDQSRTIQILLYTCFRNAGHLVLTYSTPQEALHAFAVIQDVPDIIFLFLGYEQSVYDLVAYVKSQTTYARTQLVAMVLQEEKASIQRTLQGTNVHYLIKPFQIQQALALVSVPPPGSTP